MKPLLITVAGVALLGAVLVNHAVTAVGLLILAAVAGFAAYCWEKKAPPTNSQGPQ